MIVLFDGNAGLEAHVPKQVHLSEIGKILFNSQLKLTLKYLILHICELTFNIGNQNVI